MRKVRTLLKPQGVALFSTTLHPEAHEGFVKKLNFASQQKRFRKQYDEKSLRALIAESDLQIVEFQKIQDPEEPEKFWANVILRNSTE